MPANSTITAFTTFSQNTRAKASEVNQNFQNFRGHLVPINTDTASASDLTHDLGSDEHRWRYAYTQGIDFETATTTATLLLDGDTSATLGAFRFRIEGTEVVRITPTGAQFKGLTSTTNIVIGAVQGTTIGGFNIIQNGQTIFEVNTNGAHQTYLKTRAAVAGAGTDSPDIVQGAARSISISNYYTGSAGFIAGSTISVQAVNRPIVIGFIGNGNASSSGYIRTWTDVNTTGVASGSSAFIYVMRNTTTAFLSAINLKGHVPNTTTSNVLYSKDYAMMGPGILAIDTALTMGTNNYFLGVSSDNLATKVDAEGRLFAFTLF